jgi:hypothetical protein
MAYQSASGGALHVNSAHDGSIEPRSINTGTGSAPLLYLNVGQKNGVCERAQVDPFLGELNRNTHQRFLGNEPVKLRRITVRL